ncbi:MAG: glycosyltransferase [candidate division WOR-3 bacterium]|nr:MAG: glycosyltransferase [candidate division WOR-3 bacterium]
MIGFILTLYTVLLVVLFFYSLHSFVLLYLYYKHRQRPERKFKRLVKHPNVTIQLPIYNEKYVVHRLLKSVTEIEYPKCRLEIQVLDDSDDETSEIAARLVSEYRKQNFDIHHIRRGSREGYKAGALQYGLSRAKGDFIAIFDADFVPSPNFLMELLPEFDSPIVAGVQSRWAHLNHDDSLLTRAQAIGLDNHFAMEQRLRFNAGFFINFNGTCGIWRREAIADAGGWHSDTLAEDLDLSYRVQLKGWKMKFRDDFSVLGELPASAESFKIQQNRWAKGTIQVARKLLGKVLRAKIGKVAKYEAFVHLTCHINFLALLGLALFSPVIVYFKVENIVANGYFIFASFFTIGALGYPVLYFLSQRELYPDYRRRIPFIAGVIAYSMGLSVSNSRALFEGWLNRKNVFRRTPKSGGESRGYRVDSKSLIPYIEILIGIYVFTALVYVIVNLQLILIPFLLFYSFGFLSLGFLSIKDKVVALEPQEVLCSRESS